MQKMWFDDKVGVRNPFALANAILEAREQKPILWKSHRNRWNNDTYTINKNLLEKAFKTDERSWTYSQLFDPKYCSPIYHGVINLSGYNKCRKFKYHDKTEAFKVCTEKIKGYCWYSPAFVDDITTPCPSGNLSAAYAEAAQIHFDDPVQGCTPDCYFIAALCAVTWARPDKITKMQVNHPNMDLIKMYTTTGTLKRYSFNAELQLTESNRIAFAKANTHKILDKDRPTEVWPSIYEKAYGLYRNEIYQDVTLVAPNKPDISTIPHGSPMEALTNITNFRSWNVHINKDETPDNIFSTIAGRCDQTPPLDPNKPCQGKCTVPMVAWTYRSTDPTDGDGCAPSGVTYASEMIVANHTYTVLGYKRTQYQSFIILRNPYGPCWCGDPYLVQNGALAEGTWDVSGFEGPNGGYRDLEKATYDDGIFGLDVTLFQTHFRKYGWVQ